jgi:ABC-type transport system involved in Fe-S cluster assembly fused permease/ATPase subunit
MARGQGGGNRGGKYGRVGDEADDKKDKKVKKKNNNLTIRELMLVLGPFFWPNEGTDGALINRIRSCMTWVMVACSKTCNLVAPLYISAGTNELLTGRYSEAATNIGIFCSLRFGGAFFKEAQGLVFLKVKQQAYVQLAETTFAHLHELSLNWHLTKKTGNVIRSMDRGTEAASQLVSNVFLFLGPAILECIAVIIIFFTKFNSVALGSLIIVSVVVFFIATISLTAWRKKYREATNKSDNDFHEKATDSIINFETVKYFSMESFEVVRFKQAVSSFQKYTVTTMAAGSLLNATQAFVLQVATFGALLIAGWQVHQGDMSIGNFVAVNAYVVSMFAPLQFLGYVYQGIIQGMIDVKNLSELLSESPDIKDTEGAKPIPLLAYRTKLRKPIKKVEKCHVEGCGLSLRADWKFCANCGSPVREPLDEDSYIMETDLSLKEKKSFWGGSSGKTEKSSNGSSMHGLLVDEDGLDADGMELMKLRNQNGGVDIDFNDVTFHYDEQPAHKGLKGISFHVPAGTTTAIVGHTGAGKTTISRLLFRFYDPIEGSVEMGGFDIKNYTQKSIRGCIGIVPQDTVLFNDTVLHNIRYGRYDATMEEVEAAADAAQIRTFIESLPEKWETKVGERGLKLSGGEKQRVAIARCLLKDPPVVLLDEATSALDTQTEQSVQDALQALGDSRTLLVIAHRLSTVRHAEQIIVLDNGRVAERGNHEELLEIPSGIYANLWNLQLQHREKKGSKIDLQEAVEVDT